MILFVKHISIEGPGTIGEFFEESRRKIKTIELDRGGRLPHDLSLVDAVIILGGPMNVYEEEKYPFLKDEDIFLKSAVRKGIPVLGICLGAQLLAKSCGAKVKKSEEKEIGWYRVSLTEEGKRDSLLSGLSGELDVFQWHEDTFEIPAGGTLLASSDSRRVRNSVSAVAGMNQAFRFGSNAYGIQFHIEVTDGIIKDWIDEYTKGSDGQSQLRREQMVTDYNKIKEKFNKEAWCVYQNFLRIIARSKVGV